MLAYLLGKIANKSVKLILADFKGIDFIEFDGCKDYYKHSDVGNALDYVFEELQQRMAEPKKDNQPIYFCVDEWSGFLCSLSTKKEQDGFKQKMASLLMLGRGVQIFVIMSLQRADSAYITGRDNFVNAVGLGALSKESTAMLFNEEKEVIQAKRKLSAVQNDKVTECFYVGSRKENSQLLLRVYDKKKEQINQNETY